MQVAMQYPDALMFCGHEYSIQNLEFCARVDPESETVQNKLTQVAQLRSDGKWNGPTRISEEMQYNVFMRSAFDHKVLQLTGTQD